MAAPMRSAGSGGAAPIRPGAAPPNTPWFKKVPTPVLIVGGAAGLMIVYIWWKRRSSASADDGSSPVGPDSMGQYQYTPGGVPMNTEIPGLEKLTDAINRFIDGAGGQDGVPIYDQPPNPVPVTPPGQTPATPTYQPPRYTTADVAAMFQRAGKEIEFAGSGETAEQGLARIARELELGIRTPAQVQSSIAIRPR